MIHSYCACYNDIRIRPLHKDDIEKLRQWRNDSELSKYLTPIGEVTREMQTCWFEEYLEDRGILFFSVVDIPCKNVIGTVALYGFSNGSCEVGKIVIGESSKRGKGIGYSALLMAMYIGIKCLGINLYRLNVCTENSAAYKMYVRAGFTESGRHPFSNGLIELEMVISKSDFLKKNCPVNNIKLFHEADEEVML